MQSGRRDRGGLGEWNQAQCGPCGECSGHFSNPRTWTVPDICVVLLPQILCTGQTPQSSLLSSLSPKPILPSGFVKVLNTLQISDPALPHVFAIGDVADSGAPKTARAAFSQVDLVQANILIMIRAEQSGEKEPTLEHYQPPAGGIHLSLGLVSVTDDAPKCVRRGQQLTYHEILVHLQKESVKFFNPTTPGETPRLIVEEDGTPDMGAGRMWANLAAPTSDYHI